MSTNRSRTTSRPDALNGDNNIPLSVRELGGAGYSCTRLQAFKNSILPFTHVDRWSSGISDYLAPAGSRWSNHDCIHNKVSGAKIDNLRVYDYPDPYGYGPGDCEIHEHGPHIIWTPTPGGSPPPWQSLASELVASLNGSVACGSMVAVTIGEATKTIAMLKNPFKLLTTNWRKAAQKLSAASLAKTGANVWLEGTYGWKSAYYDVKSVVKTVNALRAYNPDDPSEGLETRLSASSKQYFGRGNWVYRSGTSAANWPASDRDAETYWFNAPTDGLVRCRVDRQVITDRIGCRQLADCARRYSRTMRFLNAFALDGASIVDVLWELTPWSFVIDWFVDPLGLWKLPGNLIRLNSSDVTKLTYSRKSVCEYTAQCAFYTNPYYWSGSPWAYKTPFYWDRRSKLGSGKGKYSTYSRYNGLPDLSAFVTSLLGSGLSSQTRTISGLSLTIQKLLS